MGILNLLRRAPKTVIEMLVGVFVGVEVGAAEVGTVSLFTPF